MNTLKDKSKYLEQIPPVSPGEGKSATVKDGSPQRFSEMPTRSLHSWTPAAKISEPTLEEAIEEVRLLNRKLLAIKDERIAALQSVIERQNEIIEFLSK